MKISKTVDFSSLLDKKEFGSTTTQYKTLMRLDDENQWGEYTNEMLSRGVSVIYDSVSDVFIVKPLNYPKDKIKESMDFYKIKENLLIEGQKFSKTEDNILYKFIDKCFKEGKSNQIVRMSSSNLLKEFRRFKSDFLNEAEEILEEDASMDSISKTSQPEFILARLDEFFHTTHSSEALTQWEKFKQESFNDYDLGNKTQNEWIDYLEESNSTGQHEINVGLLIAKRFNLYDELKSFLNVKDSLQEDSFINMEEDGEERQLLLDEDSESIDSEDAYNQLSDLVTELNDEQRRKLHKIVLGYGYSGNGADITDSIWEALDDMSDEDLIETYSKVKAQGLLNNEEEMIHESNDFENDEIVGDEAYDAGFHSALEGEDEYMNPYEEGTEECSRWNEGFNSFHKQETVSNSFEDIYESKRSKKKILKENPMTDNLPEDLDSFLMDICQIYGDITYTDVMKFSKRVTSEQIERLYSLKEEIQVGDFDLELGEAQPIIDQIVEIVKSQPMTESKKYNKRKLYEVEEDTEEEVGTDEDVDLESDLETIDGINGIESEETSEEDIDDKSYEGDIPEEPKVNTGMLSIDDLTAIVNQILSQKEQNGGAAVSIVSQETSSTELDGFANNSTSTVQTMEANNTITSDSDFAEVQDNLNKLQSKIETEPSYVEILEGNESDEVILNEN